MKKIILIAILFLFTFQYSFAQKFTEYYFKFDIQSRSEIEKITRIISIDNVKGNTVFAFANEKELLKFKLLGYKIEYLQKDVPKAITMATTIAQMASWDRYPTYEVYRKMMKNFEVNYPTLCKLDSIGTTVDGRKLYVLKISDNVNLNEAEPEFFYSSTMHGDEATGFILMLRLADSLLTSYGTETEITNLVNNIEIYINPDANPDGTYYGGNNTVSSAIRSNKNGVDLNRNFKDPVDGDHPDGEVWQPETVAMMNFANNHKIVMSANFHGGIEVANYPWDNWSRRHADDDWLIRVSRAYATSAQNNSPAGYFNDLNNGITNGYDWYAVAGGRQDFFTYFHNSREVTMEISTTKLVDSSTLPSFWNYNKEALLQFMKECTYGIHGTVKNSNGDPVKAMIFIENHDLAIDSSMVFSDSEIGDYHRLIEPGTYNATASAYGYITKTINNITFSSNSSVNVDFVLETAETYTFTGNISDGISTNTPIENAKITLQNLPLDPVYTNVSGNYIFNNVPEGEYIIEISKLNYSTLIDTIELFSDNLIYNFILYPSFIEDFETGDFSKINWQLSGNSNWIIDNSTKFEGVYSAKSGVISNNNSTVLSVELDLAHSGNISFYRKVSSESGYDFLKFYIDNQLKNSWSGIDDWKEINYPVSEGIHNFKWEYMKDEGSISGSDCAWIDYISFPNIVNEDTSLTVIPSSIIDTLLNEELATQKIIIYNTGINSNSYSVLIENATENSWLSINKSTGSINVALTDTILVTLSNNSLAAGNYTTNLIITEEDNDTYNISVTMNVPIIESINNIQSEFNYSIYPNPFSSDFAIELNSGKSSFINIQLFDYTGNLVFEKTQINIVPNNRYVFNESFSDLNTGIYFLKISTLEGSKSKKVIKIQR